ncbi:MAG TPA: tripartite tricarboxylate transporter substrate binding protein [Pseudolabrys sp.]
MTFKKLLAGILVLGLTIAASAAVAQTFPDRPIRIIVGFRPASASDVAARLVGQKLGEILKVSVIVENKPGASSEVGARYVATSPPDGYTLYLGTVANSINYAAKSDSYIDLSTGLAPIAEIGEVPNVLVVTPSLDAHNVADIIRLAKAKPGELTYASAGPGTALHMAAELFSSRTGVQMLHVPYQGSAAAMPDLLEGRTSLMFVPASTVVDLVKAGKLRAIAATGLHRLELMPDLPTVAEQGLPGFESSVWSGLLAPNGLPPEVAKKLETAILAAAASPDMKDKFAIQGIDVIGRGQTEFAAYIKAENEKWSKVIKDRGLKLD